MVAAVGTADSRGLWGPGCRAEGRRGAELDSGP